VEKRIAQERIRKCKDYVAEKSAEIRKTVDTVLHSVEEHNALLLPGQRDILPDLLDSLPILAALIAPLWVDCRSFGGWSHAIALGPDSGVPKPLQLVVKASLRLFEEVAIPVNDDKMIEQPWLPPLGQIEACGPLKYAIEHGKEKPPNTKNSSRNTTRHYTARDTRKKTSRPISVNIRGHVVLAAGQFKRDRKKEPELVKTRFLEDYAELHQLNASTFIRAANTLAELFETRDTHATS
jgi:hypothetical protein